MVHSLLGVKRLEQQTTNQEATEHKEQIDTRPAKPGKNGRKISEP